jgi:hypothetical protein
MIRSTIFSAALVFAIGWMPPLAAADAFQISPQIALEINVTADSAPGWIPTADQRQRAIATTKSYLDALEAARYPEAYGLYTSDMKRDMTLAQFTQDEMKFKSMAGAVKFWRVLKITWTKDPAQAPYPGIYVAIDLASQYANVDRDCGYFVLYQASPGDAFAIMRRENNYMDNATALQGEQKQSKAAVAEAWAALTRYCPNYVSQPETP